MRNRRRKKKKLLNWSCKKKIIKIRIGGGKKIEESETEEKKIEESLDPTPP